MAGDKRSGQPESSVSKRSIVLGKHKTSITLEEEFWLALREIASMRGATLQSLFIEINKQRVGNLSSAIRLFVLEYYRSRQSGTS